MGQDVGWAGAGPSSTLHWTSSHGRAAPWLPQDRLGGCLPIKVLDSLKHRGIWRPALPLTSREILGKLPA